LGRHYCIVDDAGGGAGGGGGGGKDGDGASNPDDGGAGGKDGAGAPNPDEGGAGGKDGDGAPNPDGGGAGDAKPFLGDPPKDGAGGKDGDGAPNPDDGGAGDPKPVEESEYMAALVKDEALLGDDKSITLDGELFKSVVPILQKHGIAPAAANEMANALAKAQIEQAKAAMQSRLDYFEKMKQESLRTYTQRGFEKINAGIDKWFKPGGTMNQVIRNSELGADPEFLALMHHLGEAAMEDDGAGADSGGGADAGDPNSISGLASIW
jgi:hypothetical protein